MSNRPTFCAIIPDRGDRPKLTEFCFRQLDRMTVKPDKIYHVNYAPKSDGFDLVERVKNGLDSAYIDQIEWAFVIEDDYYPAYYFSTFINVIDKNQVSIVGTPVTVYYNLKNRSHNEFTHPLRSSLFNTAIRVPDFIHYKTLWKDPDPFLDIRLWNYAKRELKQYMSWAYTDSFGLKHGIGKCAGKGHRMDMPIKDPDLKWLRERLWHDNEAFEFYRSLSEELYKP